MNQPPEAHGLLTFDDGAVYKGLVVNGEPHGFGVMTLDDGTMYEGYWDRGKRQGIGKQIGRGFEFVGGMGPRYAAQRPMSVAERHEGHGRVRERRISWPM